jgi:hypothetical protein
MFEKVTIFFVGESYIGSAFSETAACRSVVSLWATSTEDEEADMTVFRFCLSFLCIWVQRDKLLCLFEVKWCVWGKCTLFIL